jgi:hypothetical protein
MPIRAAWQRSIAMLWAVALVLTPLHAGADERSDALVRLLETSTAFQVRTQAALSLGRTTGGASVIAALVHALADSNASVRGAAATSLGAVGDASSVAALQRLTTSSQPSAVRTAATTAIASIQRRTGAPATTTTTTPPSNTTTTPPATGTSRYYVGVGTPGTRAPRITSELLRHARSVLVTQVGAMDGVDVAPENETNSAASAVIQRRALAGVFIDCSIVSADATASGTRVAVSVVVGTYPGRDMRAILNGAATVPGAQGAEADRAAIEGAVRGALRNLPQAIRAAAGR